MSCCPGSGVSSGPGRGKGCPHGRRPVPARSCLRQPRARRRRGLGRSGPRRPAGGAVRGRRDEQRPAPARDREPAGDRSPTRQRPVQVTDREQCGHRPAGGHGDPGPDLREPGRDGHAHRHRGARPGHRARPHRPARPPHQDPHRRADPGHHDRPGRGHRLRAVPGHQAPRPDGRRHGAARVDRPGGGDLGRDHRVRRRHRDHRPAVAVGGRHPPGGVARLCQRGRRGHGRAGRHHPPARGPVAARAAPAGTGPATTAPW